MTTTAKSTKQMLKNALEQHEKAMLLADEADIARLEGKETETLVFLRQAFELERQAALAYFTLFDKEPQRSILFRSAAYLAKESGLIREAEKLINQALAGNPPQDIEEELRKMYVQIITEHYAVAA